MHHLEPPFKKSTLIQSIGFNLVTQFTYVLDAKVF